MAVHHAAGVTSTSEIVRDSLGWDVDTWARALPVWDRHRRVPPRGRALEIGAGGENGGLSLWLATRGFEVTCTSLEPVSATTLALHHRHGVTDRMTYAVADVLALPYVGQFDVVVFKSVLGRVGDLDRQRLALANLHTALRPGGELWFAENALATPLHQAARRRLGAGRWQWRYLDLDDLPGLLSPFQSVQWATFGVAAALGRTERQRRHLAKLDGAVLDRAVPATWRYVVAGVARKAGGS